jgi:hypothetical protein
MAKLTKKSSKKAILSEWLAALRGEGAYKGVYKQGKNALHTKGEDRKKDTFCCLGVLCDLAVKAKIISVPVLEEFDNEFQYTDNDGDINRAVLPIGIMEWVGLKSEDGSYGNEDTSLAETNDSGASFKKIAKIIESN